MNSGKPHILVITCHDLGHHLGCYGIESVRSPNLDRLAAQGARFEQAFCTAPQCSPSRASLATGRYPHNNGVMGLTHESFDWDLYPGERHAAALLAEAGYETHLFGFQHVTQHADKLGFQHLHVQGSQHDHDCSGTTSSGDTGAQEVGNAVEAFLRESRSQAPLYIEINFFEPHRPYDFGGMQPDSTAGVFVPPYLPQIQEAREELAALQGSIHTVDRTIGNVLDTLELVGLAQQTLVIFSADHGLAMPRAKCTLYDPGIGIALLMRWPEGGVPAGLVMPELVSNIDVLPTMLEAAGLTPPPELQGTSLLAFLRGAIQQVHEAIYAEKTFHSYYDPMRCIRTTRYKYIRNFEAAFAAEVPGDVQLGAIFRSDPGRYSIDRSATIEFYDLLADPLEQHNLAGSPELRTVEHQLDQRLWQWMEQTQDPLLAGPIPSPRYRRIMQERGT
jgi:N-sulfoglucosamine sulfohydrolase